MQLMWDSEPSRAAAALLLVLLRHVLRYRQLHLTSEPTGLANLTSRYKEIPSIWNEMYVLLYTRTILSDRTITCQSRDPKILDIAESPTTALNE